MDETENAFPLDIYVENPSSRPWEFRPQGYLVVILANTEEALRAEATLVQEGISARDIKLYTGAQILENYEKYEAGRSLASRAVGAIADDEEGRDLYVGYARDDRCAMWVRIPDDDKVANALGMLADFDYVHVRYYGDELQQDFHLS